MSNSKLVNLFVFDRLADWEIGLAVAHLNSFEGQFLPSRYRVRTVGLTERPVTTMGGLSITPDATLIQVSDDAAMLILPGGLGWEEGRHNEVLELAKRQLDAGVPVAGICGATMGLARVGILDQRRHTSNAREYLAASGYRGGQLYQDQPAVYDENVITASSVAPLPFAVEIFRRLELYPEAVLSAWQGLHSTGEGRYFAELMTAAHRQ